MYRVGSNEKELKAGQTISAGGIERWMERRKMEWKHLLDAHSVKL